ncbi:DUF6679 family protein [cf. Phormidesmis sp. LEGE 11477]|uniref:DUF6679 family protein n=1 Tax=cf. Phormidesmis sp. LEGE 11477 TaxID=1828680 RepID=UPI00188252E1|nr:DUF6679 family protein [cf. Phormidesmis sp. LEGE 11477]MBE9064514.1 hypothetical protein [cf. Phormidesmis sp. LEGE 11477]
MEGKLRELIGKPGVWLYIQSSNGWFKNVEILEVGDNMLTFRYESESDTERKIWEKTTRVDNVSEIEVRLVVVPKCNNPQMADIRGQLSKLLQKESSPEFDDRMN